MNITRGHIPGAIKAVIYGPEGIGKTTLASQFPKPLFIDTEGSTKFMDVARLDPPSSWEMLKQQVQWVKSSRPCETLVVDSADWAETMCKNHLVKSNGWASIETPGYGKGFTIMAEEWGRLLNLLSDVVGSGINVLLTAHAQMRKFEQPDEIGAYDRWELKLDKRTSAMTKEWADMILFANYKTFVVTDSKTNSKKAQGGQRVMYTTHHPAWDAKNRMNLPNELPLDYSAIAHIFAPASASTTTPVTSPVQEAPPAQAEPQEAVVSLPTAAERAEDATGPEPPPDDVPVTIAKDLRDLLIAGGYTAAELEQAVGPQGAGGFGFMPGGHSAAEYPDDFVGYLVSTWPDIQAKMNDLRITTENTELPFEL